MDLHVVLGPPGSGKAGRAVARLLEAARTGSDAFLVVPGAVDRARFLRELAARGAGDGGGAVIGVEVGTFDQLVARVAGSPPVRRTDRAMERIIVRDALRGMPEFAAAARWSGFVETAREHVDRLRRARAWGGAELERVRGELPGQPVETWVRLEQRVGELLNERHLRDDAWFERRAVQALRAGRAGVDAVVVHGFEALAPARVALVEQLARQLPVTVALPWRAGRRVHERSSQLRDRWRAMGAFVEELEGVADAHPQLAWVADELFEARDAGACPPAGAGPAPVAFVECCGPLQEVDEVVREVAELGAAGIAWDSIVVASPRADHDGQLLAAAFERAGIPAAIQGRRTALDVPAGRAIHGVLAAVCDGDPLALVAALRGRAFGLDPALVDAIELVLRTTAAAGGATRIDPSRLPDGVRAVVEAHAARDGVVEAVRAMFATLLPADLGELDLLRGLLATIDGQVLAAGSVADVSLDDVRDAIAAFPLVVPDRTDAGVVVVASIHDLRSIRCDAIVLRAMHLAGFRADVDVDADAPTAARDLLHLAVTRPRRALRVVRQAAGSDGAHLAPSPAWQELRRLLPAAPLRARRLGEVVVAPAQVRLRCEVEPAVALALGSGADVGDVPDDVHARLELLRRAQRSATVDGELGAQLAATTRLTVTEVEAYATCPAKWFVDKRLRVADPDDDRTRLLEGEVAHRLLQLLAPDVRTGQVSLDDARALAHARVDGIAAEAGARGWLDPPRLERIVEHALDVLAAEAGWTAPSRVDVERSFGREAPDSIGPGLDVDGVEVVGRVDRIDHYDEGVLLHDYKYRASGWRAAELVESRRLQLLVYWLALEQPGSALSPIGALYRAVTRAGAVSGMPAEPLKALGIVGSRQRVPDEAAREATLTAARTLVVDAVEGIRSGRVHPLADAADCPDHCTLQTVCRVGEG